MEKCGRCTVASKREAKPVRPPLDPPELIKEGAVRKPPVADAVVPEAEHDDLVEAMSYSVIPPAPAAAVLAMTAVTGFDRGLKVGRNTLSVISLASVLASFLGRGSVAGGWFTVLIAMCGLFAGFCYLTYLRWGQQGIAHRLIDRFGAARFKAAVPLMDEANRYVQEQD